jgi:hypothetical protein
MLATLRPPFCTSRSSDVIAVLSWRLLIPSSDRRNLVLLNPRLLDTSPPLLNRRLKQVKSHLIWNQGIGVACISESFHGYTYIHTYIHTNTHAPSNHCRKEKARTEEAKETYLLRFVCFCSFGFRSLKACFPFLLVFSYLWILRCSRYLCLRYGSEYRNGVWQTSTRYTVSNTGIILGTYSWFSQKPRVRADLKVLETNTIVVLGLFSEGWWSRVWDYEQNLKWCGLWNHNQSAFDSAVRLISWTTLDVCR